MFLMAMYLQSYDTGSRSRAQKPLPKTLPVYCIDVTLQVMHTDVMDSQKFWTMARVSLAHYPKDFSLWLYISFHPLLAKL